MKQLLVFSLLAVTLALPAHAFPVMRSVPPESFLDYHVDTVPQLTFEVAYDPVVRARLARHFHLTGPAMCAYVRDNLVLQNLSAPLRTRVYCVHPDGRESFVMMTLRTGSPVFALRRTGQPILRLACGNPLVAALPPTPKKAVAKPARLVKTRLASAKLVQPAPAAVAVAPAPPLAATAALIPTAGASDVFATAGAGASWLGWVPLVGGTLALASQTGGGSHNTPTGSAPITPTSYTPQASPEPSPVLVLLLGGLTLSMYRLRKGRVGRPYPRQSSNDA